MSFEMWIIVFLPVFIALFAGASTRRQLLAKKFRRKRKGAIMANEMLKKYIGKNCVVVTGAFSESAVGEITAVEDNWIEVVTKKGAQLVNADYVTKITEVKPKK